MPNQLHSTRTDQKEKLLANTPTVKSISALEVRKEKLLANTPTVKYISVLEMRTADITGITKFNIGIKNIYL